MSISVKKLDTVGDKKANAVGHNKVEAVSQNKADQINEKSSRNSEEKFKSSIDHQLDPKDILEIRDEKHFQENNTPNDD